MVVFYVSQSTQLQLTVMQNALYFIHTDFCELQLPNAKDSLLAPHDGLQYKLFDYGDSNTYDYGLYLRWPEPLSKVS